MAFKATATLGEFRVGSTVSLRPVTDVMLNLDVRVSVPSGVPPGTARTISIVIKADKSARIGSHTLQLKLGI